LSANPIARVGPPSNADNRSSKAKFQAIGLKTPPWGVPLCKYIVVLASPNFV
jgi:hypothetical protein